MRINPLREKLRRGETVIGTMMREFTSPAVCGLIGNAGFDFVLVDGEHSPYCYETIDALAAAGPANMACLARVADVSYPLIARMLDTGVDGVMVPRVETKESVEEVIAAAKYPPLGRRGWGLRRVHLGDGPCSVADSITHFNEHTVIIIQVESRRALENLEEMMGVPGVDIALVGPMDLSISLGCPGDMQHPELEKALQQVIDICRKKGVAPGGFFPTLESCRKWRDRGMRCLLCSSDGAIFYQGAAELAASLKREAR